jgi:hypothetical protein
MNEPFVLERLEVPGTDSRRALDLGQLELLPLTGLTKAAADLKHLRSPRTLRNSVATSASTRHKTGVRNLTLPSSAFVDG